MALAALAHAQTGTPADAAARAAGEQLRADERERALRAQLQPPPARLPRATAPPRKPWPAHELPCLPVRDITLAGDEGDAFGWVLHELTRGPEAAVGRCLGAEGVAVAASRAQAVLLEHGYSTSRVLIGPQDLSGGRVVLTLVPGRIRTIRFADGAAQRATLRNALPAAAGDILNLRDIEQGLENFKRLPTVEADIQIHPADAPDESDVVISWQQAFPFRLTATLDDSGTRGTGKYQGSATVSYDHWWTLNDLFYLTWNHDLGGGDPGARGTRGYTVYYAVPWDYWMLGFTASDTSYHQTAPGLYEDVFYNGSSQNADVRLSRVVHRDAYRKTTLAARGWLKRSDNYVNDTELETQRRATGGWELSVAHGEFIGPARLDIGLAHRRGTAAFGARPLFDAPEEGTARMRVTTADVTLNLPLRVARREFTYQGTFRGQWNGSPLTPADRFAIGGRHTVRGFDGELSLSAERGWFVRNDVSTAVGSSGLNAYAGLDYGQVRGAASDWLVGKHLAGAVFGLRGTTGKLAYDFFVGRPVSKPTYFRTAPVTAGFSLTASL